MSAQACGHYLLDGHFQGTAKGSGKSDGREDC